MGCSCVLLFELLSEESGRYSVESIVRTLVVVAFHPLVCKLSYFVEGSEGVGIEDFFSEATIESLDVTVLHGATGLDELKLDVVGVAPGLKFGRNELGAVIDSNLSRQLPTVFELLKHTDDARCGQGGVDFDGEHLTRAFIEDVKGAKGSAAVERVLHEVHGPLLIDLGGSCQGLAHTSWDTLFGATFLVESHSLVDAMEAFVIDASLLLVEPSIAFPEAPTGANP